MTKVKIKVFVKRLNFPGIERVLELMLEDFTETYRLKQKIEEHDDGGVPQNEQNLLYADNIELSDSVQSPKTLEEFINDAYEWRVKEDIADGEMTVMCFRERKSLLLTMHQ